MNITLNKKHLAILLIITLVGGANALVQFNDSEPINFMTGLDMKGNDVKNVNELHNVSKIRKVDQLTDISEISNVDKIRSVDQLTDISEISDVDEITSVKRITNVEQIDMKNGNITNITNVNIDKINTEGEVCIGEYC